MERLLVSWNVAGRVTRLAEQAARVAAVNPDVVCLQEVTVRAAPRWDEELAAMGLEHVAHPEPWAEHETRTRRLAVLVAAREPIARATPVDGVPWPERALSVYLKGSLEVIAVHSPISPTPGLVKVRTHEALFAYLSTPSDHPRVLCGDLNTPRREHPDGSAWTFARDRYGRLRPERGERWDAAELALIRGLEPYGFRDAYRALHGHEVKEPTWEWPRWGGGYRLDHLIASSAVEVLELRYEHDWRREGLSDHSALIARIRT